MKNKKPKEKKVKPQKVKKEKIEKAKKERKPWSIQTKLSLFGLSCIALYLAIAIPMHLAFPGFSMPWFWFGFIAVAALVAPIEICVEFVLPLNPAQNLLVTALKRCIYLTFNVWLFDLFYMAIFNQWIVWEYIFGLIAIVILFTSLIHAFLSSTKSLKRFLPIEFLADVGLSVYLIYRIPNTGLQTIVTTVVAAIYGGLLTLTGVAWTIRRQDLMRQEDNRRLYKPFVFIKDQRVIPKEEYTHLDIISFNGSCCKTHSKQFCFKVDENNPYYEIKSFVIQNSEFAYCSVNGCYIDEQLILLKPRRVLDKNAKCRIYFDAFTFEQDIRSINLLLEDMLGNLYRFDLEFKKEECDDNRTKIHIQSGIRLTEVQIFFQEDAL